MAVFRGSRYAGLMATAIKTEDNKTIRYLHSRTPLTREDVAGMFTRQTFKDGFALDLLAFQFGGSSRRWWLLAELNDVFYMHDVDANDSLLVPPESEFQKF